MDETQTPDPESEDQSGNIRQLREKAKKVDEAEAALASAQREIALLRSGIDVEHPVGKLFVKAYDGAADPEAIKAAAQEYGVPIRGETHEAPPADPEPSEPTGTEARQALAAGAPPDTGVELDPNQVAFETFKKAQADGERWTDAAGFFVNSLAQAAMRGDPRVTLPDSGRRR